MQSSPRSEQTAGIRTPWGELSVVTTAHLADPRKISAGGSLEAIHAAAITKGPASPLDSGT
jgi:hypothetical protein